MKRITILVLFSLLFGLLILSPIQLGVLTSDSMEPTMGEGESFLFYETTNIEEGDIIIFTEEQEGLVTHRIVEETTEGYITQGDNNPITDQSAGRPPVQDQQIEGKVIKINNNPFIIPFLPLEYIQIISEYQFYIISLLIFLMVLDIIIFDETKPYEENNNISYSQILNTIFIFSLIIATIFLYFPATSTDNFVVNDQDINEEVIFTSNFNKQLIYNSSYSVEIYEVNGKEINNIREHNNLIFVDHGPYNNRGPQEVSFKLHSYPKVLPTSLIRSMHNIHPIVPSFLTPLLLLTIIHLISLILLPTKDNIKIPKLKH